MVRLSTTFGPSPGASLAGAAIIAIIAAIAAPPADAGVIIDTGGGNFAGDSNVVFNPCGANAVLGPSLTVTGCLNDDHAVLADFTSTELLVANGGQALVEANDDDGFTFLGISARTSGSPLDFDTLITSINANNFVQGAPQGAQVDITPFIGGLAQATQTFAITENGLNTFRLRTDDGTAFSSVNFQAQGFAISGVVFEDFRQTRLGVTAVPEPATMGLLGAGLLGLAALYRRRTPQNDRFRVG